MVPSEPKNLSRFLQPLEISKILHCLKYRTLQNKHYILTLQLEPSTQENIDENICCRTFLQMVLHTVAKQPLTVIEMIFTRSILQCIALIREQHGGTVVALFLFRMVSYSKPRYDVDFYFTSSGGCFQHREIFIR